MITQENAAFLDAVRRADAAWLSGSLDTRRCPPGLFGRLLRHTDPRIRYLGLVGLDERTASALDPAEEAEFAALLPGGLPDRPEEALVLARLYERLGRRRPGPWPAWRTAQLPARVQIAWLRAELGTDPSLARREPPGELLYQAVREIGAASAPNPGCLIAELLEGGDPVLRAEALRLSREGLHAGLLAPALVRRDLVDLLGSDSAEVAAGALGELAEPWAALDPLPSARMSRFLTADSAASRPDAADAALTAAVRHGHSGVLRDAVADPGLPPDLRRRALELLGDLAGRGDIDEVAAIAADDPLLFGAAAVACLRGLHRRGHFPDDHHVPAIVDLALADRSIAPRDIATVLFTCRHALFRTLADAPPEDPSWPRRLALLVALAGQGTGDVPIGDAVARMLPLAPAPGPFLAAVRDLRHTGAEDAVLALLPAAPGAALAALEAIGGPRTAAALRDGLGLNAPDGTGPIAPHLRADRAHALALLWGLTEDPGQRRALVARLDPGDLPAAIAADLGGPDPAEVALLTSHLDPDDPVAALRRLAAHGGAAELATITDLLLRIAAEAVAAAEPDAPARPTGAEHPVATPEIPQDALDALRGLGRRLYDRARIRPSCLLDASDGSEAGDVLAAELALDLLDRSGLSSGVQAVLLDLLLRAPSPRTRPRVHRLLRHRDRHVRSHAIALLARDTAGDGAQALSASVIALTAARDVSTVRQALLALGRARAHWAAGAIAACLDHPNMTVKKTAAQVLATTATPAAVPALLAWLGRHDNPGLRAALTAALRAVLGGAFAATLLAAAEHAHGRTRDLLLAGLGGALPARSLLALHDQASPVAPALLALAADGRVALAAGTVDDLAAALAEHGIPVRAEDRRPPHGAGEADLRALAATGWDPATALRAALRADPPPHSIAAELRALLADWLALAAVSSGDRSRVLRFTLRLCPAPWTAAETAAFARHTGTLLTALADAAGEDRDALLTVLEAVAPTLPPPWTPAIADAVRALPEAPAGKRSALALLRRSGAVLRRSDVEQALAAARVGANPWRAETAVLREAFGAPEPAADADAVRWRAALGDAVRTPQRLAEFRRGTGGAVGSRERLAALADAYAAAPDGVRTALLDWMAALQPLDTPPWTITETAHAAPPHRPPRTDDVDRPRSARQRGHLLRLLDAADPERRNAAARELLRWPEPENRLPVLRAFLRGRVEVRDTAALAEPLASVSEAELRGDGVRHDRAAEAARDLGPEAITPLVPLLLDWWGQDPPEARAAIARALSAVPADTLALHLADRIDAGAWGVLDLLGARPLLRTPALERACRRLREEGRADLADRLRLVDGPVREPGTGPRDTAALVAPRGTASAAPPRPSRRALLDLARTGSPEQIRRALTRLAEDHAAPGADRDPHLRAVLEELLTHPRPKVRLHAHRTSRALLGRNTYLGHTEVLLDDPQPDVVRSAVRTLSHAAWEPAIPAMAGLLDHGHPVVRKAAADGLALMGTAAVPVLTHAAARARPDRRRRYTDVLDRITADST